MGPLDHNQDKQIGSRRLAWWDMLLGFVLLCGLVAAGAAAWPRFQAEQTQGPVELMIDWDSIEAVARASGESVETVLAALHHAGAVSVALPETTVAEAAELGWITTLRRPDIVGLPEGEWPAWLTRLREEAEGQHWPEALEPIYIIWQPETTPHWLQAALVDRLSRFGRMLFEADGPGGVDVWTVGPAEVRLAQSMGDGTLSGTIELPGVETQVEAVEGPELPDATDERLHRPGVILGIGLGFDPDRLQTIHESGLRVAPRPLDARGIDAAWIEARTAALMPLRPLGTVVFAGERLPGGAGQISSWATALGALGSPPALIEFSTQRDLGGLAAELDEQVVRLHSIQAGELQTLSEETVLARWLRAVRERGIRALYIRLYTELPVGESSWSIPDSAGELTANLLSYNVAYVTTLAAALEADGFEVGPAQPLAWPAAPRVPGGLAVAMFLAVAASGVCLIRRFVRLPWLGEALLLVAVVGGLTLGMGAGFDPLARQMGAFAAAVLFPTLGVLVALDGVQTLRGRGRAGRLGRFGAGVVALAVASVVSLLGAMLVVGLLAEPRFMLALDTFVGVKAMHVIPPLLVAGAIVWQGPAATWRKAVAKARGLLWERIPVIYLLGLGLVGGIAVIIVLRTGNDGLPVVALEDWLRSSLEQVLVVRPRNKEFLFGHPLLVVLAGLLALGVRRFGYGLTALLAAMASVGQLSMVNTFAHIHTPLLISLARTGYGLMIGALLGVVILAIVAWGWQLRTGSRKRMTDSSEPGEIS